MKSRRAAGVMSDHASRAPGLPGLPLGAAASAFRRSVDARYTVEHQISAEVLKRWLRKSIEIHWDHKNIVERKGRLERLT